MREPTREEYRSVLEKTIAEADQLLGTFNALLMIARAEAGHVRDAMTVLDLRVLIGDVVELYEPLAEESDLKLVFQAPARCRIRGNRELLSQAIANLIDNAIKHGRPKSGSEGVIEVLLTRHPSMVTISVGDKGPGIPEHQREHVLDRFVRLEESRNTPGSGLGLSLVAAIARLHHGRVELLDNAPGLRAEMKLPLNPTL